MNPVSQMLEQGLQYHQAGNLHQAELLYQQILKMDPRHAAALHLLGLIAHQAGRNDQAVDYIQQALRLHPQFPEAHNNLGVALKKQGKLEEATASFQQALRLKPDYAEAYNNLGNTLKEQGKLAEASASYQQALRLKPDYAEAYDNLGLALRNQGKPEEAIVNCRQALRLKPDNARAHNTLGIALLDQGKLAEAIASYQQALSLKPDFADAHLNLGNARKEQGQLEDALASYQRALLLNPGNADYHKNLAFLWLLQGNFEQGWIEFEWRWQTKHRKLALRPFPQPLWQGNPLRNGTILLHAEQGLGDAIQFIRYAALVKERVGKVLCECPAVLVRLFQSCPAIDKIIPFGEPLPPFDVHASLMSLPGILKTTLATIPAGVPYVQPNAALTKAQARVLDGSKAFKIGIVWQGNPKSWEPDFKRSDALRSFPLAHFEPLACLPGVRLISLQKGHGIEQLQELAGRFPIVELGSTFNDFSDTAAVMKNLDLVISADTSPAHLAGALGVPVWVALPIAPDWRWLLEREDSPWYPTMRLFRQTACGDWHGVFERMAEALSRLVARFASLSEPLP